MKAIFLLFFAPPILTHRTIFSVPMLRFSSNLFLPPFVCRGNPHERFVALFPSHSFPNCRYSCPFSSSFLNHFFLKMTFFDSHTCEENFPGTLSSLSSLTTHTHNRHPTTLTLFFLSLYFHSYISYLFLLTVY